MAFNGSGVFTVDAVGNPVQDGLVIDSAVHNDTMDELAAGLSQTICRDGQSTITQNIPFNSQRITGLGNGLALTDAMTIAQGMQNYGKYVLTVGGTANAITLTPSPAITGYTAGAEFVFMATATNTSTVTVNVSSLGVKDVRKPGAIALTASDIVSGQLVRLVYDGTWFIIMSPMYAEGVWTPSVGGTATYTTQTGRWTKNGRAVTIMGLLTINTIGTGSTSQISGAPFTSLNLIDQPLYVADFASLATNVVWIAAHINSNATTIDLRNLTAAGASATSSALLGNGASVLIGGTYFI